MSLPCDACNRVSTVLFDGVCAPCAPDLNAAGPEKIYCEMLGCENSPAPGDHWCLDCHQQFGCDRCGGPPDKLCLHAERAV